MDFFLQQRQDLKLFLTTQLRQSIELLQYSTNDLEQFIRQQELENPLICLQEFEHKRQEEELYFVKSPSYPTMLPIEFSKATEEDFRTQLLHQVNLSFKEIKQKKLLAYIINNLNNNGFLEIEETSSCYSSEDITLGIELLQQIGPTGIGARSVEECLLLQSEELYPDLPEIKEIILHYLPLLAEKKFQFIAQKLNCSVSHVVQLNEFIMTLNPKPCAFMQIDTTEFLHPDIIVELQDEQLSFYINDRYLPQIKLHEPYLKINLTNREDKEYIHNHYKNYQWLLNSINQRRNTISKIMYVLLKRQSDFFRKGPVELVPLTLKEVADEIGIHESTVSRATSNKYVQTPIGIFDLKLLFTHKLEKKDGSAISQEKVKQLLKQLIDQENKQKPYSDQKIAEYFHTEYSIQIARRTINKYRVEMNIPSASMRKQWR